MNTENYKLLCGDALEQMATLDAGSINLIAVDLPYGITHNKWDSMIPLEPMWEQFNRVIKENGAVVLTAVQPFASHLILSNLKQFRYEIIWEKTVCSGQMNVNHQPMRSHENILVFYRKLPTYNEQRTVGTPYEINRPADYANGSYGKQKANSKKNDGFRHARSVVKISNPRVKGGHPTQKPVKLMEYIILAYSNENDLVLDCCMGSGTTGEATLANNRRFVGIELDKNYFDTAKHRIQSVIQLPTQ